MGGSPLVFLATLLPLELESVPVIHQLGLQLQEAVSFKTSVLALWLSQLALR